MSWDEIKKGREIWPPNIEQILKQYEKAERLDPKYFQIYKDRARLFYVLKKYEQSTKEYEKWKKLGKEWEDEVIDEMKLRKQGSNDKIHPWVYLKKFLDGDTKVDPTIRGKKSKPSKNNREKRIKKIKKHIIKREIQKSYSNDKNNLELNNSIDSELDNSIDSESDDNLEFMYYDQQIFEIIINDIRNNVEHTIESIQKKEKSFKIYFKYLYKVDKIKELFLNSDFEKKENTNFEKLYNYCKIKIENRSSPESSFDEIINKDEIKEFTNFFSSNKKYLEKWSKSFCELFVILYQYLHKIPIIPITTQNIAEIIEPIKNKIHTTEELQNPDILECCKKLIYFYKNKPNLSDKNIELMEDMIDLYDEIKSLKQISQITKIPEEVLRKDFRNLNRVPKKLKEMIEQDRLGNNIILSVEIALFATDYYFWDGEKEKEEKIIELAQNMVEFINDPRHLELKKEFFTTKIDYSKPVSARSQNKSELDNIYENWPVVASKNPFDFRKDRSKEQYRYIVFYSKSVEAARFVRRWENENTQRIPKTWASEIIEQIKNNGHAKEFVLEHSDEFQD